MAKKPTETKLIAVRLPLGLVKRIDTWSKKAGRLNTSDAIRALIDAALDAKETRSAPPPPVWVSRLEEVARRSKSDVCDLVEILIRDIDEQLASGGTENVDPRPMPAPVPVVAPVRRNKFLGMF